MSLPVCSGAMLLCSCGLMPAPLLARSQGAVNNRVPPVATVLDAIPMVSIPPFGGCTAPGNPAPPPLKPCTPLPLGPWPAMNPGVCINGVPVLADTAVLPCAYGGVIQIALPGQLGLVLTP